MNYKNKVIYKNKVYLVIELKIQKAMPLLNIILRISKSNLLIKFVNITTKKI